MWSVTVGAIIMAIGFSSTGEALLRFINGARAISTAKEKEFLYGLLNEVYEDILVEYPGISKNIELYIDENLFPNAYAFGSNTIVFTRGALNTMPPDLLKGLIAHEIGHIYNGDTKVTLFLYFGGGIFSLLIWVYLRLSVVLQSILLSLSDVMFFNIVAIFIGLFKFLLDITITAFILLSQAIIGFLNRNNEFIADEFAYTVSYGNELL
jgi:heat shock protein HtpX